MSIEIKQLTQDFAPHKKDDFLILHDVSENALNKININTILSLKEFNLSAFGAVTDGVVDDTAAILGAINAAKSAGGGIIVFPEGVTHMATGGIDVSFATKEGCLVFRGAGSNSVLKISNATTDKILISNSKYVAVEKLTVIGTPTSATRPMLNYCFKFSNVDLVNIDSNIFAGVRCVAPSYAGGVVVCDNCNLVAKNNLFGGCSTYQGFNLYNINWRCIYSENNIFTDYITVNNVYYDMGETAGAWIGGVNVTTFANSKMFYVKNNVCDEGAQHSFYLYNGGNIDIDGLFVNQGIGFPVMMDTSGGNITVKNAIITTTIDTGANRAWLYADGAKKVKVENVTCLNNSRHIHLLGSTEKIEIDNCSLNIEATYPTGIRNEANAFVEIEKNSKFTNVANLDYTAKADDNIIIYTSLSASRTVTLPSAIGLKGKILVIKDMAGSADVNNIVIDPYNTETIEGASSKSISTVYGKITLLSLGTSDWAIL